MIEILSTRDQDVAKLARERGITFQQASKVMQDEAFAEFMAKGNRRRASGYAMAAAPSAPAAPPPPPGPLQFRGKTYDEMNSAERADLHAESLDLFNRMRAEFLGETPSARARGDASPTAPGDAQLKFRGKTYSEMNSKERANLHAEDRSLFNRMREQAVRAGAL